MMMEVLQTVKLTMKITYVYDYLDCLDWSCDLSLFPVSAIDTIWGSAHFSDRIELITIDDCHIFVQATVIKIPFGL